MAQLQKKVEKQDEVIIKLQEDALNINNPIEMMEEKLLKLEGQNMLNKSLNFVRNRVTEELQSQLVNLQHYKEVFGSYCWCEERSERKERNFEGGRV